MKNSNKAIVSYKTAAEWRARRNKYFKVASLLAFFVCWEIIGRINLRAEWINAKFLPMPSEIIRAALTYAGDGTLWKHMGYSLYRVLSGFVWGVVISMALGSFIAESKTLDNLISPILNLFGPIPIMAFLPMFILWFGIGETSKIILIAYATVISMVSYVTEGIKNTDPALIRSAASLGANSIGLFVRIKLQSAFPGIFVGMKNALGVAFGAMVVAEMMGASTGLGYIIVFSKNWFKMSDMLMAAIIIGLLYSVIFSLLTVIENFLFRWKKDAAAHAIEK
jgi:sulfonate transport system permease protein